VTIAGVFVGGMASRMGGSPKGLLVAPGGRTILDRWRALLASAGVDIVVLVGRHPAYAAYTPALEIVDDEPRGIGPLGGLVALLKRAGECRALALACDMPFVTQSLLTRLIAAPAARIVAPRLDGRWEPLCARYEAHGVLPHALRRVAARQHSLQGLLDEAGAAALPLEPGDVADLRDWDAPDDLRGQ
jgi:molybdopterin-guanine dinucleotide biosynthesis protein A